MAVKEIPVNFRGYYKTMRETVKPQYEKAVEEYEKLLVEERALYSEIKGSFDTYKKVFKIDLSEYEEFMNNEYSSGVLLNDARGLFVNRKGDYKAHNTMYRLYKLAKQQKDLKARKHQIDVWERMLDLKLGQYRDILETFYNEVVKHLILKGEGYVFEGKLGWLCINRCKYVKGKRQLLDYKATKENKQRLLDEGKRLWNKEEADYAASLGLEYDGVDYRIYKEQEYLYEFALINCRLLKGDKVKFKVTDSHRGLEGKTEDDIMKECNNDLEKICELRLTPRRKLDICLKADNILYLNFIRNAGQQSVKTPAANRQS